MGPNPLRLRKKLHSELGEELLWIGPGQKIAPQSQVPY